MDRTPTSCRTMHHLPGPGTMPSSSRRPPRAIPRLGIEGLHPTDTSRASCLDTRGAGQPRNDRPQLDRPWAARTPHLRFWGTAKRRRGHRDTRPRQRRRGGTTGDGSAPRCDSFRAPPPPASVATADDSLPPHAVWAGPKSGIVQDSESFRLREIKLPHDDTRLPGGRLIQPLAEFDRVRSAFEELPGGSTEPLDGGPREAGPAGTFSWAGAGAGAKAHDERNQKNNTGRHQPHQRDECQDVVESPTPKRHGYDRTVTPTGLATAVTSATACSSGPH